MSASMRSNRGILKLVYAAVCLALCLVLPFLTGQIPEIGGMLCPMHLPVLLAGFLCGPWWAMGVGFVAPLLRYILFSMPPILPTGLSMCFELLTYGLVVGLLCRVFPGKNGWLYPTLILAMLAGRVVWGVAGILIYGAAGAPFTWALFWANGFAGAIPGILVQIILIPPIVMALRRAKLTM